MTVKDLFAARMRIRMLEEEVQNPMNVHRWRALEVIQRQTVLTRTLQRGDDNSMFYEKSCCQRMRITITISASV